MQLFVGWYQEVHNRWSGGDRWIEVADVGRRNSHDSEAVGWMGYGEVPLRLEYITPGVRVAL